jgi:Cdc6-like AAA superfamily ATPase
MPISNSDFYSACNLTGNPFRSNATFDDDPRLEIWAAHDQERKQLEKFLLRSRADQVGNASLILLYGPYGTGKSHALLWGMNWLNKLSQSGKSAAYYIPTLKKDKGRLTFAGALKDDLIARTTLVEDVRQYRQFLLRAMNQHVEDNGLGHEIGSDQQIEQIIRPVELYNFAKQIYRCETPEQIIELICEEKISDYQAMTNFARLVNLFVYQIRLRGRVERFRESVHLMIDELDALIHASSKDVLEVNDLIRHLYDMCPNCFGLVLAVSAEQDVIPSIFTDVVISRVTKQIEFGVYDRASAVEFVTQILDHSRVDERNKKRLGSFPFTNEVLEAILGQLNFRSPRKVVNVMQLVLEEARLADLDPHKAPIGIRELDQTGIMDEIA